ncbi:Aldo/keto reductase [Aspergillus sclerotiicarbonarius CBS 121057]|uniref:Aldo/keto reductase n=1 Tax=Aspergillus sclerotiicarbonarius (strain CBS 121057 / IBT 28362) TaxID=1448318 RepID=A0A319DZW1_ASPSB|nr:Aldo/keto reductase [Aspergillus sclerotiicarbonarius CBS 121057]
MTTITPQTPLPVIFGSMTIGRPGTAHVRISTPIETNAMLDVFQSHGHHEIDTARVYGAGSTETYLAEAHWHERGLVMATKLYPTQRRDMKWLTPQTWTHSPEDIRAGLMESLEALNAKSTGIDMFYLHGPDRDTPIEETLAEVDKLFREGHFRRFGISNFQAWEVARICEICERNGYIKPTTYQGIYNAYQRSIETELLPCLRHYGIGLYAFQPLAAGFLTARYHRNQKTEEYEVGSRFDPRVRSNLTYHNRYLTERSYDAIELLRPIAKKYGLTESECGLRWMVHHSALRKELHDALIIGASSADQLKSNLVDLEKGPLPEEIVQALDEGWKGISGTYRYWH